MQDSLALSIHFFGAHFGKNLAVWQRLELREREHISKYSSKESKYLWKSETSRRADESEATLRFSCSYEFSLQFFWKVKEILFKIASSKIREIQIFATTREIYSKKLRT